MIYWLRLFGLIFDLCGGMRDSYHRIAATKIL